MLLSKRATRAIFICLVVSSSFSTLAFTSRAIFDHRGHHGVLFGETDDNDSTSFYDSSGASSKALVSSLTGLVNFFMTSKEDDQTDIAEMLPPPSTPMELLQKISEDYTTNNYLWTGDIYLPAFEADCRFTDPTLSFEGRDKFVSNVQNLRPIVDALIAPGGCRSDLLEIDLNEAEGYVQSRWNMVGELNSLPWKPKIDVIGRTKFWFRKDDQGFKVYFYDECWELPAGKALLQLITPGGTIPNSSESKKS